MKHKVIDNFLDEEYFDSLVTLITDKKRTGNFIMPWFFQTGIVFAPGRKGHKMEQNDRINDKLYYMFHMFYENNLPKSDHYEKLIPLLDKLKVRCLLRVKANLFPNTEILHEHYMHEDDNFSHSGALLSLNTCDGYTKLKDGTKIDSVANRILLFDPSEEHASTTTTNVSARMNININYIQVEKK